MPKKGEGNDNNLIQCINCYNCKTKNKKIFCKENIFSETTLKIGQFFTPYDFECLYFISMDE